MAKKNQSTRLTAQHKNSHSVAGIFGDGAKSHDLTMDKYQILLSHNLKKNIHN